MIANLTVRIAPRRTPDDRPFTEIFYDFEENGRPSCALSRCWYAVSDTPMDRANEAQAFMRRQARPYSDGSMP